MFYFKGESDIGYGCKLNQDYIFMEQLDESKIKEDFLAIIADGQGTNSFETEDSAMKLQPCSMIVYEISTFIKRLYKSAPDVLFTNAQLFLKEALLCANRVLAALQQGNEEEYGGFSAAITCCLIHDSKLYCAHAGNTRLYLFRPKTDGTYSFMQITKDQTKAQLLVDKGLIQAKDYYSNPDRNILFSGIGVYLSPQIQQFHFDIKPKDILLMTTDGIHYCLSQKDLENIIIAQGSLEGAIGQMITDAKAFKYVDNMSALMLFNAPS